MATNPDRNDVPSEDPTLAELLELFGRALRLDLRVCAPATTTALPVDGRVSLVLGHVPVAITREGEDAPQAPVVLPGVPVAWLGGSAGYVTTALPPGSTGLVVFSDRAIGSWLDAGAAADPELPRTHSLADGFFLPTPLGPQAVTHDPTGTVLEGALVKVGAGATHPIPHGDQLVADLATWIGAIALAGSTWASVAPPTAISNGAFIGSLITATADLGLSLAGWLSTKGLVA